MGRRQTIDAAIARGDNGGLARMNLSPGEWRYVHLQQGKQGIQGGALQQTIGATNKASAPTEAKFRRAGAPLTNGAEVVTPADKRSLVQQDIKEAAAVPFSPAAVVP